MTKIYAQLSADNAASAADSLPDADALNAMRLKQKRNRTMSECAGMHYANINFTGSNNNPIVGKSEMEKTYYTGTYLYRVTHLLADLGWVDLDFDFLCLPDSAWAGGNLAEVAELRAVP